MRPVNDKDFDAIYEIYTDDSVNRFMNHDVDNKQNFKPVFEEMKESTHFWVFEDENGPYGMCNADADVGRSSQSVYFRGFGVKSSKQGKGYGKKIIRAVETFLKKAGYKTMFFLVEGDNKRGIKFYDAMGFEKTGVIPKYLKRENEDFYVDEIIYAKVIN